MALHLVTLVGGHVDVLPFFLEHYRQLGVTAFSINVHLTYPGDPVREEVLAVTDRFGIGIESMLVGDWLTYELDAWIESMRRYPNDWWLLADQDEFHLYQEELCELLAFCDRRGYDHVQGTFVDRVSTDGRYTAVDYTQPLWPQYPLGGIVSARLFGGFDLKVVAAKGRVAINRGHHLARKANPCPIEQVFTQVHHFKWTGGVVERQQRRADHFRRAGVGHWTESAKFVMYSNTQGHRINIQDRQFLLEPCTPLYPHFEFLTAMLIARRRRRIEQIKAAEVLSRNDHIPN